MDTLRRLLEAAYSQSITFIGESRKPSGTPVDLDATEFEVLQGQVTGIVARDLSHGEVGVVDAVGDVRGGVVLGVRVDRIAGPPAATGEIPRTDK